MAFTKQEEAALRGIIAIFQTQAAGLSGDLAEQAVGLFEPWDGSGHPYSAGDRISYEDALYTCLQAHTSQPDWTPAAAPSLWARNLPAAGGADGTAPDWVQPDSTNGYKQGAVVAHNGKVWRSLVDNNVWEPGVAGTEGVWQEVTA